MLIITISYKANKTMHCIDKHYSNIVTYWTATESKRFHVQEVSVNQLFISTTLLEIVDQHCEVM